MHQLYNNKGLTVIAVSIDRGGMEKVRRLVARYVNRKKLTFLNLLDPEASTAAEYGVRGVPMNIFINSQGKAVALASGYRKWGSKDGLLMFDQLLSE